MIRRWSVVVSFNSEFFFVVLLSCYYFKFCYELCGKSIIVFKRLLQLFFYLWICQHTTVFLKWVHTIITIEHIEFGACNDHCNAFNAIMKSPGDKLNNSLKVFCQNNYQI